MGGSQSTRDIVVEDSSVIQVSEDVQRRLQGLPERQATSKGVSNGDVKAMKSQMEKEYRQMLTNANSLSYKIRAEEFAKAVQEVEEKFIKQSGSPIAQEEQQRVYECYQENLHKPLNCSQQVKQFMSTVEKARQNAAFTMKS